VLADGGQNCQGQQQGTKCCPKGYKPSECQTTASSGAFYVNVAGTRVSLKGEGTRSTRGSVVAVARVAARHLARQSQAFKLLAVGRIPVLRLAVKGRLYKLNVATNRWKPIRSITRSGIYEAVFS
jgi:hypothetical protein